tara:strand:- start:141 stop:1994 length:1854 start_codon:yes stop_codon:yes gene_type:complete
MKQRTVVCDIEADGLLPNVTTIWCIVCKDYDTGEIFSWTPDTLDKFSEFASNVRVWIGHNFIAYDLRVLKKILDVKIRPSRVRDTLLISRLQQYSRYAGHSLAAWGKYLNYPKSNHTDFTEYSEEMLTYCINDVELTYKVARALKFEGKELGSERANTIEHITQHYLEEQKEYGFTLDRVKANLLFAEISNRIDELEEYILSEIEPKPKFIREIVPKFNKGGTISKIGLRFLGSNYTIVWGAFSRIEWQEFKLKSPKQKVERLRPWWKPTIRTKGYRKLLEKKHKGKVTDEEFEEKQSYMWQLCDENFETISSDAPQSLRSLGEYAICTSRYKVIEGWLDALGNDNRIHSNVFSIGAITHRMSHNSPNMANIPSINSPYGRECRSCFVSNNPDTHILLGCDAAGIQLRILAHYMNDPDYTDEVVNGDIHTKNLESMGIDKGEWNESERQWSNRSIAKTFIYAWLLGAGDEKIGRIINGNTRRGRKVKEDFLRNTPALVRLKHRAREAAGTGRMVGLDGRKIEIKSEHFALSAYLQGGEAVIMKYAMCLWHQRARKLGLNARQVAIIHDEFQVEVLKEHADKTGEIIVQSIIDSGKYFELNCPLDGAYKVGRNWYETH